MSDVPIEVTEAMSYYKNLVYDEDIIRYIEEKAQENPRILKLPNGDVLSRYEIQKIAKRVRIFRNLTQRYPSELRMYPGISVK